MIEIQWIANNHRILFSTQKFEKINKLNKYILVYRGGGEEYRLFSTSTKMIKQNLNQVKISAIVKSTHHAITVRLLQLAHLCGHFYPKVNFIAVLEEEATVYFT